MKATSSEAYSTPPSGALPGRARTAGRVAAQRQHVADAGVAELAQDRGQLVAGVPDAGQVGHREQRGLLRDPPGDRDRAVAGGAAGAVGHRHERRPQRLELADRAPEHRLAVVVLGREELEGEGPLARAQPRAEARPLVEAGPGSVGRGHHARSLRGPHPVPGPEVHSLVSSGGTGAGVGRPGLPRPAGGHARRLPGRAGRPAGPARTRRRPAPGRRAGRHHRRQALPRRVLLVGPPCRRPRPRPGCRGRRGDRAAAGLRGAGAAARQRAGARRLHGRLRHPPRPAGHAPGARGRAPHRRAGADAPSSTAPPGPSCSATCSSAGPTSCSAAAACRPTGSPPPTTSSSLCRTEVIAGQFLDVSVQARGRADVDAAMTVLRYKSAKYSIERPLQIGAALAGAGPDDPGGALALRAAARRGLPAARRPARRLRRPRRSPASRPVTTWSRASARCWSPSRSTPPPPPTRDGSTARSAPRSTRPPSPTCARSSTAAAPGPRSRP